MLAGGSKLEICMDGWVRVVCLDALRRPIDYIVRAGLLMLVSSHHLAPVWS